MKQAPKKQVLKKQVLKAQIFKDQPYVYHNGMWRKIVVGEGISEEIEFNGFIYNVEPLETWICLNCLKKNNGTPKCVQCTEEKPKE